MSTPPGPPPSSPAGTIDPAALPADAQAAWFGGLLHDAALFPPASAALAEAVPAHRAHRAAWYGALVGPFVCSDRLLPQLSHAVVIGDEPPLPLAVAVAGGAGSIGPAVTWAGREPGFALAAVEIALRDEPDRVRNTQRVIAAFDDALPDGVDGYVEVPLEPGWPAVLDAIAATRYHAKLRTGGPDPAAFPAERDVAAFLLGCLDRELPLLCTAGLHHAVRQTDELGTTAVERHGILNVLLAVRAGLDGAGAGDVAAVLAERDPAPLRARIRGYSAGQAGTVRRFLHGIGSCSIAEPVQDLVGLGLLAEPAE